MSIIDDAGWTWQIPLFNMKYLGYCLTWLCCIYGCIKLFILEHFRLTEAVLWDALFIITQVRTSKLSSALQCALKMLLLRLLCLFLSSHLSLSPSSLFLLSYLRPPLFHTHKLELVIFYPTQHTSPLTLTRTRFLSDLFLSSSLIFITRSLSPSVLQMKGGSGLCLQGFKCPFWFRFKEGIIPRKAAGHLLSVARWYRKRKIKW